MEVNAIFCLRIDFTKMFVMSLDFADVKNNKNMSKGMTYRTHLALQLLYFDLYLIKQYNIMFESVNAQTDSQTDRRRLKSHPIGSF